MSALKSIVVALSTIFVVIKSQCLHNGCQMSEGLPAGDIDKRINGLLNDGEYIDNVLKIATWNIQQDFDVSKWDVSDKEVCRFLKNLQPLILGLQGVNPKQLLYLKNCLRNHEITGGEFSPKNEQNLIVYQNSRRLKVKESGSFEASEDRAFDRRSSCTWIRFRFADRLNGSPLQYFTGSKSKLTEKLSRLLNFLVPQKRSSHFYRSIESFYGLRYKWYNFYVASVKINSNSEIDARGQLKMVLDRLKNEVMDRRRYPLIVLLDLGKEDDSLAYQYFESRNWLKNTMRNSILNLPAMSSININDPSSELLSESVWESRFHGIVSAVISDSVATEDGVSMHRPVFTALLRHRRGNKN